MTTIASFRQWLMAGVDSSYIVRIDTAGRFTGWAADIVNGAPDGNGGMHEVLGIKSAPMAVVEPPTVNITGRNRVLGTFANFPPDRLPQFIMTAATFDMDTVAGMQSSLVQEYGDFSFGVGVPSGPTYPPFALILAANALKQSPGKKGVPAWAGYIVWRTQCVPLHADGMNERREASTRYRVTMNEVDKDAFGVTITPATHGACGLVFQDWTNDYPLSVQAWIGDGMTDTFNLQFEPAEESGDQVVVIQDGVPLTYIADYEADAAAREVQFTAPPDFDSYNVALYGRAVSC